MGRDFFCAFRRWRWREWAVVAAFASVTVIAYVEKRPLQSFVQVSVDGSVARALASLANVCGSGFVVAALWATALVAGIGARKPALVDTALALGAGGVWCWLVTNAGQLVLAERRPNEGGAMQLFALGGHGVSGHAAAAALLFWPVRDVLLRHASPRVRGTASAILLAWAIMVGWSRVWLGMHFVWNVMLGLEIGFGTGFVATRTLLRDPVTRARAARSTW